MMWLSAWKIFSKNSPIFLFYRATLNRGICFRTYLKKKNPVECKILFITFQNSDSVEARNRVYRSELWMLFFYPDKNLKKLRNIQVIVVGLYRGLKMTHKKSTFEREEWKIFFPSSSDPYSSGRPPLIRGLMLIRGV